MPATARRQHAADGGNMSPAPARAAVAKHIDVLGFGDRRRRGPLITRADIFACCRYLTFVARHYTDDTLPAPPTAHRRAAYQAGLILLEHYCRKAIFIKTSRLRDTNAILLR